jgi:hypothetical protein
MTKSKYRNVVKWNIYELDGGCFIFDFADALDTVAQPVVNVVKPE